MDKTRCKWLDLSKPDYIAYHDEEWGVPIFDDRVLFEFLTLESAQAGLSWYTILQRRSGYKEAFANFDVVKVASFDENKIEKLVINSAIIRNRSKIVAAVNNAQKFITVQQEFGSFAKYIWGFVGNKPLINTGQLQAKSPKSDALSKDLKKRGFKFVGSTTCYSMLQACGMINDHSDDCFRKNEIIKTYNSIMK